MASNITVTSGASILPVLTVNVDTGSTITVTKGSTTLTGTSASGQCIFNLPEFGTWSITATLGGESASDTVTFVSSQSKTLSYITYLPIGGRIFYIHDDNGATYRFFDENYNEITDITVAGLANAVYYVITGTPSANKFYILGASYDDEYLEYGAYGTAVGSTNDGIGAGKINTSIALATPECFVPRWSTSTIWKWLRDDVNGISYNGYNDWFIGSKAEIDEMRLAGFWPVETYSLLGCSVEIDDSYAYIWNNMPSLKFWENKGKSSQRNAVAFRAF